MTTQAARLAGQPAQVIRGSPRWLGLGAMLVVGIIVGGLAGWLVADMNAPGKAAAADTALVDRSHAIWTNNDQAGFNEVYAASAMFQDSPDGTWYVGGTKIAAYIAELDTLGFIVERVGPTTRVGNYVLTPVRYGRTNDWSYQLTILELKDGKIVMQTGLPMPAPAT